MAPYKIGDDSTPCPGVTINVWAFDFGTRFTINDNLTQLWEYFGDVKAEADRRCAAIIPFSILDISAHEDFVSGSSVVTVRVTVEGTPGTYKLYVGDVLRWEGPSTTLTHYFTDLSKGIHIICANTLGSAVCVDIAVSGDPVIPCDTNAWSCILPLDGREQNGCGSIRYASRCDPPTPPPPPVACGAIPVDSWSITTNNPLTGARVPFTIRSKDPNKHFLIQTNVLGGLNTLMTDGTTDSTGCFTGELNALPDGTYNVFVCYDILGICPFGANIGTKSITWGTKPPLSIDDIIKYAPYLIGAWAIATIAGAMRR